MNEFDEHERKPSTEYIVFQCTKCNQFTYAKVTQKGKKCPRCSRNHIVADLEGKIVEGPTNAMKLVKKLQNSNHRLETFSSTKKSVKFRTKETTTFTPAISDDNQLNKLLNKIIEWQKNENVSLKEGFPGYLLDYIAKEVEVNTVRRNILVKKLYRLEKITRLSTGNVFVKE